MYIELYTEKITTVMMSLLLTADPDTVSIQSYITNSKIIVGKENDVIIGIAVLVNKKEHFELKNIAISNEFQGKGLGKKIINEAKVLAKSMGAFSLDVGTGNSSLSQLAFYQKCGFRMHSIEVDYFKKYPKPIYENGIQCIDMIKLRAEL